MKHPLVNRTSPKGQPFIGTCAGCGKSGITFDQMSTEECENVRGMTNEQALLESLQPVDKIYRKFGDHLQENLTKGVLDDPQDDAVSALKNWNG